MDGIMEWWNGIKSNGFVGYALTQVLPAVILLAGGLILTSVLERQTKRFMAQKGITKATIASVRLLIRWVFWLVLFLAVATMLGVDLKEIWATTAALLAMAAVGLFAGWSLISSSLAMLIILIWRPYVVGDKIEVLPDSIQGTLDDIDFMFCRIVEEDGNILVLTNSQMLQKMVRIRRS